MWLNGHVGLHSCFTAFSACAAVTCHSIWYRWDCSLFKWSIFLFYRCEFLILFHLELHCLYFRNKSICYSGIFLHMFSTYFKTFSCGERHLARRELSVFLCSLRNWRCCGIYLLRNTSQLLVVLFIKKHFTSLDVVFDTMTDWNKSVLMFSICLSAKQSLDFSFSIRS